MFATSESRFVAGSIILLVLAIGLACQVDARSQPACTPTRKLPDINRVRVDSASGNVSVRFAAWYDQYHQIDDPKQGVTWLTLHLESVDDVGQSNDKEIVLNMDCAMFKLRKDPSSSSNNKYEIEGQVNVSGDIVQCKPRKLDIENDGGLWCDDRARDLWLMITLETLEITYKN